MPIRLDLSQRIFSICLILAIASWLSVELSRSYSVNMPLRLQFDNLPRGLYIGSDTLRLPARIRAKGYALLAFNWFEKPRVVIDAQQFFKKNEAFYYWVPAQDRARLNAAAHGYEVLSLAPDTLTYPVEKTLKKRLPIKLSGAIGFARGYDGVGPMHKVPDSVWVTAPDAILDTLPFISTSAYRPRNVKRDITAVLHLVNPYSTKLRMAVDSVAISWKVDRFTEAEFPLSITAVTLPSGGRLKLFPSTVRVRFRVALSHYEEVRAADFQVAIDTTELSQNPPYLPVKLVAFPSGIKEVTIRPRQVEYLIIGT